MTREERIKLAIEKGYTYDEVSGKIFGVRGSEIISKKNKYIFIKIRLNKIIYQLYAHQFAYYSKYNKVVDYIDHIDGDRSNNKINNLREVTNQQNTFNRKEVKGYFFNSKIIKYEPRITLNNKQIYLGRFNTELEARNSYLEAKEKYHLI
jgi:hypothetical protein